MIVNLGKVTGVEWTATFNEGAIELIIRSAQGNLRLCRNLCYARKTVTIADVNAVLVQPHWRSHEELIKQQVS